MHIAADRDGHWQVFGLLENFRLDDESRCDRAASALHPMMASLV
jgi:hypothetical protein